jgi:hypothetical protein
MEKVDNSITFLCPSCCEIFEFDDVGEYQLVSCPICGIEYITVKKDQRIQLQNFEFGIENNDLQESSNVQVKLR